MSTSGPGSVQTQRSHLEWLLLIVSNCGNVRVDLAIRVIGTETSRAFERYDLGLADGERTGIDHLEALKVARFAVRVLWLVALTDCIQLDLVQ